ncbi:thialysine N-epsilon-acetyltransferase-like isoform X1 [Haliotis rubra]|uniref:thialysine N-epsilon-acetyltransferase-like isoform X1 n=1 Tax=Haliotis rubra TaxID=36100 RepID=UPI001EE5CAF8|nr:thialysine N-epsilon-acetyltransferase-like isoform X1 [Haliotis rubra]
MADLTYRHAEKDDCDEILRLIKELAEFENLLDQVNITSETLKKDGFGEEKLFHCIVAEERARPGGGDTSQLIGYLLYFWSYGTFTGRVLYVEDLYVSQNHRRRGVASALWEFAMKVALEKGCKRMQWVVLDWNTTAINFYKKMGAVNLSKKEGWLIYRLNEDDMRAAVTL